MFGLTQIRIFLEDSLRLRLRLLDQFDVGDARHAEAVGEARLARAEKFARTADLQIFFRQHEAVVRLSHDLQAFVFGGVFARGDEQTVRLIRAAPDAPAQLMQLRQTEAIRAFDQHDGRVGNIHADFDDGCRNEDVVLLVAEFEHGLVFFTRTHLAMQQSQFQIGEDFFRESLVIVYGGAGFDLFALFDERINDERLFAVLDLTAHNVNARSRSCGRSTNVLMGIRPAGISSMMERSRSP